MTASPRQTVEERSEYGVSGHRFDRALVDFAESYADQNERDQQGFMEEIRSGRLAAEEG